MGALRVYVNEALPTINILIIFSYMKKLCLNFWGGFHHMDLVLLVREILNTLFL